MPREKVSVHLDNTGYYRGDKIWFQCYVVDGFANAPTQLSRTLYVELLNPRGKVISRQTLRVENGRCHGVFSLDHLPFYSGFYEIRAYTKYMLNFGEAAVYSRVIPVFDPPKKAGDYSEWKMTRHISKYPGTRQATKSGPDVSMRFFPEGGSLVAGVPGRVAFEITGRGGMPLEGRGRVIDESDGHIVAEINTLHEGRGVFELTPEKAAKYKAVITCSNDNGEHKFRLPQVNPAGIGLSVDNLSSVDSIFVTVRPAEDSGVSGIAGLAISSRGIIWSYTFLNPAKKRTLKFSTRDMPSGVSVITLFGNDGHTLAERMVFIDSGGYGSITTAIEPLSDGPSGKMILDLAAVDAGGNPAAQLPLSVAITDGDNAVDYQGGLLSDLLLMSEIKGYVRNPMQYFRSDSVSSRSNLDLLMMVQGWRCYSWEEMAGIKPMTGSYYPEQAIDVDGRVVSFVRGIPKPGVDVSVMITESDVPDSLRRNFMDLLTTDSCGSFRLSYDLNGKWNLLMSVREKGKKKDHRIVLDRLFSPSPRKYDRAEMVLENFMPDTAYAIMMADDTIKAEVDADIGGMEMEDSLFSESVKLKEVTVKGKRGREAEIFKARSKAVAYYDIQEELGGLADKGKVVGNDLFDILESINPSFQRYYTGGQERLFYGTRKPLFVINYERTFEADSLNYTLLYPEAIKSVYITQDPATMLKYSPPEKFLTMFDIDQYYGCAVLIETFPGYRSPAGKGTRLQSIEGYTVPEEFQNIDSESLLDKPDLRRTLYWNPLLTTGDDGKARVEFFNNSTCRNLRIDIQGIDSDGTIYSR